VWSLKTVAGPCVLALAGLFASGGIAFAEPEPAEPPPGPKTTIDADGTYSVGADIAPGTYQSAGPVEGGACYWKRIGGNEILDNAMSKKAQVVQIEAGDTAFTTSDCQPWAKTDCAPGCLPAPASPLDVLSQLGRVLTSPKTPPAPAAPAGPLPAEAPAAPTP
jgi:hypothetical protein